MAFKDIFNKNFETRDDSPIEALKSHYYRCRYNDALKKLKELINNEKAVLIDENPTYHEYLFRNNSYDCVCTLTEINPTEIAIDFKIQTFDLLSFGKGKKIIAGFYKYFDSNLNFKGLGLYKG